MAWDNRSARGPPSQKGDEPPQSVEISGNGWPANQAHRIFASVLLIETINQKGSIVEGRRTTVWLLGLLGFLGLLGLLGFLGVVGDCWGLLGLLSVVGVAGVVGGCWGCCGLLGLLGLLGVVGVVGGC